MVTGPACWSGTPTARTREMGRHGGSKAAAERALKEAFRDRAGIDAGTDLTPQTRVRELAEAWFASLEAQSPTTRQSYRNRVDNQILPALGELRLRELTTGTVDRFLKTVAKCSGPSMAKMTRSVLSGMCGLAARHDAVDRNPVRDAQVINQPRKAAPVSLTVKEVRQLRALMTYDDRAVERDLPEFVSFMLATGLRIGEASAVTWAAVDLDAERVEIRGTVVRLKGHGLVLKPTTETTAGMRMLALPSWCIQMLHARRHDEAHPASTNPSSPHSKGGCGTRPTPRPTSETPWRGAGFPGSPVTSFARPRPRSWTTPGCRRAPSPTSWDMPSRRSRRTSTWAARSPRPRPHTRSSSSTDTSSRLIGEGAAVWRRT